MTGCAGLAFALDLVMLCTTAVHTTYNVGLQRLVSFPRALLIETLALVRIPLGIPLARFGYRWVAAVEHDSPEPLQQMSQERVSRTWVTVVLPPAVLLVQPVSSWSFEEIVEPLVLAVGVLDWDSEGGDVAEGQSTKNSFCLAHPCFPLSIIGRRPGGRALLTDPLA